MSNGDARGTAARAGRLARTLTHLHPLQLALRPVHVARGLALAKLPMLARAVAGSPDARPGPTLVMLEGPIPKAIPGIDRELERARNALGGQVEFVGRTLPIRPPETDFIAPEDPKLVRYQLTYLEIARSLAIAAHADGFERREEAAQLAVAHMREFVERVPPGPGDAWEPYPVAMRILNLVLAADLLRPLVQGEARAFLDVALPASLAQHARWMCATLEWHLLGNHLFTDGVALFIAGCALESPAAAAWRNLGAAIVARSVSSDVLPDGGHDERSPTYHALYLDQLSFVLAAARAAGVAAPAGARAAAEKLARHLVALPHPDGELPLFGDSAVGEAASPWDLASAYGVGDDGLRKRLFGACGAVATWPDGLCSMPETGFAIVRVGDAMLAVDAGPLGGPHQPGHAHADALTFEYSHEGSRLIVDGGAGHYHDDEARAYFRGPFAHNAVSVDGAGSDEVWSSFRAAGRGQVEPLTTHHLGAAFVLRGAVRAAAGWHHERLFFLVPGALLAVFDRVERARAGAHVRSHLLFGRDVAVARDGAGWQVTPSGRPSLSLRPLVGGSWSLQEGALDPRRGWRSERLGRFEPAPALELEAAALGGAWGAAYALVLGEARVEIEAAGVVRLDAGGALARVWLDRHGLRWEELGG